MALLWGVGQVAARQFLLIVILFLDRLSVDRVDVPPTVHAVILVEQSKLPF